MTVYRPVLDRHAVIGCKLKQNANEGCNSATVVQVLQDLFYVLLHVLFYLWSLLKAWYTAPDSTKINSRVRGVIIAVIT